MKWVDNTKTGGTVMAKVGILELHVYEQAVGGWFAVVGVNAHFTAPGRGPYRNIEAAKRAAVRLAKTLLQAVQDDLQEAR